MTTGKDSADGWWGLLAVVAAFVAAGYFGIGPLAGLEPEPKYTPPAVRSPLLRPDPTLDPEIRRMLEEYPEPGGIDDRDPVCVPVNIVGYECE